MSPTPETPGEGYTHPRPTQLESIAFIRTNRTGDSSRFARVGNGELVPLVAGEVEALRPHRPSPEPAPIQPHLGPRCSPWTVELDKDERRGGPVGGLENFDAHDVPVKLRALLGHLVFERPVDVVEPTGPDTMIIFAIAGTDTIARVRPQDAKVPGTPFRFEVEMGKAKLFDRKTEMHL